MINEGSMRNPVEIPDKEGKALSVDQFLDRLADVAGPLYHLATVSEQDFLRSDHTASIKGLLEKVQALLTTPNSVELRKGLAPYDEDTFFDRWAALRNSFHVVHSELEQNAAAGVYALEKRTGIVPHSGKEVAEDVGNLAQAIIQLQVFLNSFK